MIDNRSGQVTYCGNIVKAARREAIYGNTRPATAAQTDFSIFSAVDVETNIDEDPAAATGTDTHHDAVVQTIHNFGLPQTEEAFHHECNDELPVENLDAVQHPIQPPAEETQRDLRAWWEDIQARMRAYTTEKARRQKERHAKKRQRDKSNNDNDNDATQQ